jgi:hypothetical protein
MANGVRVRGECPAGHVTETVAPRGRVTWHGECSADGCDEKVLAKRIPRTKAPETPAADSNGDSQYPFVKVSSYGQLGAEHREDGITVQPESEPGGAGEQQRDDGAAAASPAAGVQQERAVDPLDEPRPGFRDRLRSRRPRGEWQHPLL